MNCTIVQLYNFELYSKANLPDRNKQGPFLFLTSIMLSFTSPAEHVRTYIIYCSIFLLYHLIPSNLIPYNFSPLPSYNDIFF